MQLRQALQRCPSTLWQEGLIQDVALQLCIYVFANTQLDRTVWFIKCSRTLLLNSLKFRLDVNLRPKREDAANEDICFYRQLVLFMKTLGVFFIDSVERVIVVDAARVISTAPNASSRLLYFGLSSIVGLCTEAACGEAILGGIAVARSRVEQAASEDVGHVADASYMQAAYDKSLSKRRRQHRGWGPRRAACPKYCFFHQTRILHVTH